MKNIMYMRSDFLVVCACFLISASFVLPMYQPRRVSSNPRQKNCIEPDKTIDVWKDRFDKSLQKKRPWSDVLPGAAIITPDEKGFVMGYKGAVYRFALNDLVGAKEQLLFEHPRVKHAPMIAIAQQGKELIVVSAGNYHDVEKEKYVSEYILFGNGAYKIKKLDKPIQAIKLGSCGKILAIAFQSEVNVINLENDESDRETFKGIDHIVDLAISPKNDNLVAVDDKGIIYLMSLVAAAKTSLMYVQEAKTDEFIKNIYFPYDGQVLYVTHSGQSKTISLYDIIEPFNEQLDLRNQTVCVPKEKLGYEFSCSSLYRLVSTDPGLQLATAHWTNDVTIDPDILHKIKVYQKNEKESCIKKMVLGSTIKENRYDFIAEQGHIASEAHCFLMCALRGNKVIALATDGKMRVWSLAHECTNDFELIQKNDRTVRRRSKTFSGGELSFLKYEASLDGVKEEEVSSEDVKKHIKAISSLPKRRSSHSSSRKQTKIVLPTSSSSNQIDSIESPRADSFQEDKKKKSSPRRLQIFKNSSSFMPYKSAESSPTRSPREKVDLSASGSDIRIVKTVDSAELRLVGKSKEKEFLSTLQHDAHNDMKREQDNKNC